ncbi:MAG TPA: DUF1810 domain-containing protein [Rhizomicrobium sp.]|jgi:uncharacterized protein (DUF1810 family)
MSDDAFDLQRFVKAQDPVFGRILSELRAGQKRTHWMWFVFPQIAGLGFSAMAQRYAIQSLDEAKAYFAHPVLGARLRECSQVVLDVEGRSALAIFGSPDDVKFRSCMTLFEKAVPDYALFGDALKKYFGGERDAATLARL